MRCWPRRASTRPASSASRVGDLAGRVRLDRGRPAARLHRRDRHLERPARHRRADRIFQHRRFRPGARPGLYRGARRRRQRARDDRALSARRAAGGRRDAGRRADGQDHRAAGQFRDRGAQGSGDRQGRSQGQQGAVAVGRFAPRCCATCPSAGSVAATCSPRSAWSSRARRASSTPTRWSTKPCASPRPTPTRRSAPISGRRRAPPGRATPSCRLGDGVVRWRMPASRSPTSGAIRVPPTTSIGSPLVNLVSGSAGSATRVIGPPVAGAQARPRTSAARTGPAGS